MESLDLHIADHPAGAGWVFGKGINIFCRTVRYEGPAGSIHGFHYVHGCFFLLDIDDVHFGNSGGGIVSCHLLFERSCGCSER
ncbi:hypothetical protein D3C75_746990 [compost metagenome]